MAETTCTNTLKRKHSLQDSSVDCRLLKRRALLNDLNNIKINLEIIERTEESSEVCTKAKEKALKEVFALENRLGRQRATFSTVSSKDLEKAGVKRKHLDFVATEITNLTNGLTMETEAQIADLHSRIKDIYACVNMDYEPGPCMILNAILLAVWKIAPTQKRDIAIIPDMRIDGSSRVQIFHPISGDELWLSGKLDRTVIEYNNDNQDEYAWEYKAQLVGPGGSRKNSFAFAKHHLLLVQAKFPNLKESIFDCIPEAVSQAIALLKSAKLPVVHFCLSDGQQWIFFVLKSENNTLTYYESVVRCLPECGKNTYLQLREIVMLLCEWLRPTVTGLFELK